MKRQSKAAASYSYLDCAIRKIAQASHLGLVPEDRQNDQASNRCGAYLPDNFRQPCYVVSKWLDQAPPEPGWGRQWAFIRGQYVLAEIRTGLIVLIVTCIQ